MRRPSVTSILKGYERGYYTRLELLGWLNRAAAETPPEALAQALPPDLLQELRQAVRVPPASPDDFIFIHGGTVVGPVDWEAYKREQAQLSYDGTWAWHRYFYPTESSSSH